MSEPGLKCENNCTNFKQIFTLKLFIAFEITYSCCFSFGGNLDFSEFLQKGFITSTTDNTLQSRLVYSLNDPFQNFGNFYRK